ncbi:MAG: hypothetical protein U0T31_03460 [Chitinophagales bacterium]
MEQNKLIKIPASVKTDRLNEWKIAFPDYVKTSTLRISKRYGAFVFHLNIVWDKFDNTAYSTYLEIDMCVNDLLILPDICLYRELKYDNNKAQDSSCKCNFLG